jgi:outer membrane protein assembly factor BamB
MVDSGRLYFCSGASLFILSMVDGSTLHEVSLPGVVDGSSPSMCADGQVVVGTAAGALVRADPTDAAPVAILHAQLGAGCSSQPVCDPMGNIVVATVDGAVQCLALDGSQLWKVETGLAQWLELSVASDGTIFAAGTNGGTYVIGQPE